MNSNQTVNELRQCDVPVLLVFYRRPDTTKRVFEAIRAARPTKLFLATSAPNPDRPVDKELCNATREVVANIDWPCEVYRDYREERIDADHGVPTAVSWMFEHVDRGIILEDDCVPNISFFNFCEELLEKYKGDRRVMSISGSNFQDGNFRGNASYYFSNYAMTWGWATWKRAWDLYDPNLKKFPDFVQHNSIAKIVQNKKEQAYWVTFFNKLYTKKFAFWDTTWIFAVMSNGGLSISSNYNLIQNIGFGSSATHTKEDTGLSLQLQDVHHIIHPDHVEADQAADTYFYKKLHSPSFMTKVRYKLTQFFSK